MTPLHPGDLVLVIGADSPHIPQPGALGNVFFTCPLCTFSGDDGYIVVFAAGAFSLVYHYRRPQLRKLEPPADPETDTDAITRTTEMTT